VVESGQTISEIAQAYKVSQEEIMNVNKIKNASRIRVGQKLLIPKH
jgi:LysM repeat protein